MKDGKSLMSSYRRNSLHMMKYRFLVLQIKRKMEGRECGTSEKPDLHTECAGALQPPVDNHL